MMSEEIIKNNIDCEKDNQIKESDECSDGSSDTFAEETKSVEVIDEDEWTRYVHTIDAETAEAVSKHNGVTNLSEPFFAWYWRNLEWHLVKIQPNNKGPIFDFDVLYEAPAKEFSPPLSESQCTRLIQYLNTYWPEGDTDQGHNYVWSHVTYHDNLITREEVMVHYYDYTISDEVMWVNWDLINSIYEEKILRLF
jgi:hypothetical protein